MQEETRDLSLFYDNIKLVFGLAKRMNVGGYEQEDLIQAGLMGLHQAINNFDPTKGKFQTYASFYIISEIKKEMKNSKLIKLSKEMYKVIKKLKNCNLNKTIDEISEETGYSKEMIINSLNFKDKLLSLNNYYEDSEFIELVEDNRKSFNFDLIYGLDDLCQEIILLKYYKGYSQEKIAKILKISQSKVSRLEKLAFKNIRDSR